MYKRFKYWFYGILVGILAALGYTIWAVDNSLEWTNPTTFTDGSTIPVGDLVSVRIFRKVGQGAYSLYQTIPINTQYVDTNQNNGTYCYQVAVVRFNGIQSGLSNEACRTVDTRIPNVPTVLSVN